jgi:uncharacterized membrane protein
MTSLPPLPGGSGLRSNRLQSIDLLRGAIMILMVIDHVRCYTGLPAGGPEPGIFFTRWVTHYCAPVFCFFAGVSAFLYGHAQQHQRKAAGFLATRGLLLVVLELTIVRFFWAFHVDYTRFVFMGILWMLGWCMLLLALLVRLKPSTVSIIGLAIIVFQQLFGLVPKLLPASVRGSFGQVWEFIYPAGQDWPAPFAILYVIVPWIGVMAAGYGFGAIFLMDPVRRRRICLQIGLYSIAAFVIGSSTLIVLQPQEANAPPFIYRLLNQRKYPASTWYLLMTLGPAIALIPYAEKARGWLARILIIIGRVPLFYYLLHIPLIHLSAVLVNFIKNGFIAPEWYVTAPFSSVPPEYTWSLGLLYGVILIDVVILYVASRWYGGYKQAHPEKGWLKYL